MKKTLYIFIFCLSTIKLSAQFYQDYSQYMFNGLAINPAYTGSREAFCASVSFRKQWASFEGTPVYETVSAHTPIKSTKTALGLFMLNEKIGLTNITSFYINYAYRLKMGPGKLSLGLKGGFYTISDKVQEVILPYDNLPDPAFQNLPTSILPNFGFGFYYYTDKFFVATSVPQFLSKTKQGDKYVVDHDFNAYNYLLTSGFLLDFNENFKIKPSLLAKYQGGNVQVDINTSFVTLNENLWIGGSYRTNGTIIGIFEFQANKQLRLGISYDQTLGSFSHYNDGSLEIILRYEFSYKIRAYNPRYL